MRELFLVFVMIILQSCLDSSLPVSPLVDAEISSSSTDFSSTAQLSSESQFSSSSLSSSTSQTNSSSAKGTSQSALSSSSTNALLQGSLEVSYTPVSNNGKYSPRNVYAVWLTDANGNWVANVGMRGLEEFRYLYKWRKVYTKTPVKGVDGVTGATALSFSPFTSTYAVANLSEGSYNLHMEFTTFNIAGPYVAIPLRLNAMGFDTTATTTYFQNIHIKYLP